VLCGSACVDTKTNALHCNMCNRACGGGKLCVDGKCTCSPTCDPSRETCCDGFCQDLRGCAQNTFGSCGTGQCVTCGNVCPVGQGCCNYSGQLDPPLNTISFCIELANGGFCPLPE
jgi:hypothetical protein